MTRHFLPLLFPLSVHAEPLVPPPLLEISPQDILETRTIHDGNRLVIAQELDSEVMQAKVEALRPAAVVGEEEASPEETPVAEDPRPLLTHFLGASVCIPDPAHPERVFTYLRLHDPQGGAPPVSLWTNVNFLWLTGRSLEVETSTGRHTFILMASAGTEEIPADLSFPEDGSPGLVIAEGNPTEDQLAPIDQLLQLYARDRDTLRESYETSMRDAAAAEVERRANPPEKKDLLIRWWRADAAAADEASEEQGGAQ